MAKVKNSIKFSKNENVGRLDISGTIGFSFFDDGSNDGASANRFRKRLSELEGVDRLDVHIHSQGGNVFEGITMYNYLKAFSAPVHVYIDGLAASIASVIAMAGAEIHMPANTFLFIHKPWVTTNANAKELRKAADDLDLLESALISSYMSKFTGSESALAKMLEKETWIPAKQAAQLFKNVIVMDADTSAAACLDDKELSKNAPEEALAFFEESQNSEQMGLFKRFMNYVTNHKGDGIVPPVSNSQEIDMTSDEIAKIASDAVAKALDSRDKAAQEAQAKVDADAAKAKAEADAKAKAAADAIAFEGDKNDPAAVQAHIKKLKDQQLRDAVNWSDPESVAKYHKAISAPEAELPAGSNAKTVRGGKPSDADVADTRAFLDKALAVGVN